MRTPLQWTRALLAGAVGGIAFVAALFLLFTEIPPPRTTSDLGLVLAGVVPFGLLHGLVFAALAPTLPGRGWRKGLSFGILLWLLMILWFEFFVLLSVMHPPWLLFGLELGLWLLVNLVEGTAIALVYRYRED